MERLEERIDDLIAVCKRLQRENDKLQSDQKDLAEANSHLSEKTQKARARIEAMIDRLKALERS
ncbi:MAG TPA: cell division protein ZapB [Acidiferrobacterales bacterium]|nr:cell division protein ZapB [Acidiferrobacterales bacterium]